MSFTTNDEVSDVYAAQTSSNVADVTASRHYERTNLASTIITIDIHYEVQEFSWRTISAIFVLTDLHTFKFSINILRAKPFLFTYLHITSREICALFCFDVIRHIWFYPYPSGFLHLHRDSCMGSEANLKVMMTSSNGSIFRVTGHLCGEFTGHRWIPHTKASDA